MRTSLDPFGILYVFKVCVSLPFTLPQFTVNFLSDKYTLIFSNLNASKIPYNWNGLESKGQFYFVPCIGKLSFGVSICTVADKCGVAVFGDESAFKDTQKFIDDFRDKCKAVCANPKEFGLI